MVTGGGRYVNDLVVCSLEPWDHVWRRNQFLVDGLLRHDHTLRVLFVEPARDPLHLMHIGQKPGLGRGRLGVPGTDGRLHRLELTKWLPRAAGPMADLLLQRGVREAAAAIGMRKPLLWVNDPGWAGLVAATNWPAIYDITDDWVAADRPQREHDRIVANEAILMQGCREVVVCSEQLKRTKSAMRPVELVPNAVNLAWYRDPQPRPEDLPRGQIALYAGTLHEDRLDVDLAVVLGQALSRVGAQLVFVGPNALGSQNTDRLAAISGVHLLGSRPYRDLPAYLQHADVLVVPHLVNDFTDSLDPIKFYEYQAAQRLIVSTPVAGFRQLAGLPGVAICEARDFPAGVVDRLQRPPESIGPFDVADWDDRVVAMERVLSRARAPRDNG